MFNNAKQTAKGKVDGQSTVPVDIFVGNGSRLSDKNAVEDYHANSIVSHDHRMSFKMRRPVRLYAMTRDGLAPVKVRSKHIFSSSDLPPSFDLETVIQLEAVWYAAYTGVSKDEDFERTANAWSRVLAVVGAVCIAGGAMGYRMMGGGPESEQIVIPAAEPAAALLRSWMGI